MSNGRGGEGLARQHILATTAAILVLIAGGVFLSWSWSFLSDEARAQILAAVGIVAAVGGRALLRGGIPAAVGRLVYVAGLGLLLFAIGYSSEAWPDASVGALLFGLLALLVPILGLPTAVREDDPVVAATSAAAAYGFIALFLDRALGLDGESIVWVLDGVLVLSLLGVGRALVGSPGRPAPRWILPTFLTSLHGGFVLVLFTGTVALDLDEQSVYGLDLWLGALLALTLWGIHYAPAHLRRHWYPKQLALLVLLGVGLAYWTVLEGLDLHYSLADLAVVVLGGSAITYALRTENDSVLAAGCLALVIAAWHFGIEQGALGAVAALVVTAVLLFWLAHRLAMGRSGTAAAVVDRPEAGSLPSLRVPPPGPRSRDLAARLRRVESRNVTHLSERFPVFWESAEGAIVRDPDGNEYLDLAGAFGVALLGHGAPSILRRVEEQLARLAHGMGDVHPPVAKVEFLERLTRSLPWDDARVTLASSGSEAVEIALKTAQLATGRPGILAFEGGYHGLTLGALAATSRDDFRRPFAARVYGGVARLPFPTGADSMARVLAEVDRALDEGAPDGDPIGALIVEPIQGRAGVLIPPEGFLGEVVARSRAAGAVTIFDEVFTGMGRTGRVFGFEHEGVVPDLLCLGKALGGGLPLSACAGPAAIMDAWPESTGEALHTSTFLGHPLSCAAGLAVLDAIIEGRAVERAAELGKRLLGSLRLALAELPAVGEVRGRGLLIGIALVDGAGGPLEGGGARVAEAALAEGVLVLPAGERGEVVQLAPPVILGEEQLAYGVEVLVRVIGEL